MIPILSTVALLATPPSPSVFFVHHGPTNDTDPVSNPFWGSINKGAVDAAALMGVDLQILPLGTGVTQATDMGSMLKRAIDANATAIVTTVTSTRTMLTSEIQRANGLGIPVTAVNAGIDIVGLSPVMRGRTHYVNISSTCGQVKTEFRTQRCCENDEKEFEFGDLEYRFTPSNLDIVTYVGQDDFLAGRVAGTRSYNDGNRAALCLIHEPFASHVVDRCEGYRTIISGTTFVDIQAWPAYYSMFVDSWPGDPVNDPLLNKSIALIVEHPNVDAIQVVTPVQCLYMATIIAAHQAGIWSFVAADRISRLYLGCFDFFASVEWFDNVRNGIVKFTIDQGAYVQGYYGVQTVALKSQRDIRPFGNILSGPRLVDATNVDALQASAFAGYA